MSQTFNLDANASELNLSWINSYDIDLFGGSSSRFFNITLREVGGTQEVDVFSQEFAAGRHVSGGWLNENVTLTAAELTGLLGKNVSLAFENVMPQSFTGPAGFGLDDIVLSVETRSVPAPFTPALFSAVLLGLGVTQIARKK